MKFVILQALTHLHFLPTHFLMISPIFSGEHLLTTLLANISYLKHGLWNHKASNHGRRCADGSLQPELAMLTPGPADLVRNILHTRASTQTRSSSTLPLLKGVKFDQPEYLAVDWWDLAWKVVLLVSLVPSITTTSSNLTRLPNYRVFHNTGHPEIWHSPRPFMKSGT